MGRAGPGTALPLLIAGLLAAAGIALIASSAFRTDPAPRADPCAERLVVFGPDGTPVDVVARCCERLPGGSPALLIATRDAASARAWRDALPAWARGGRTTWLVVLPGEDEAPAATIEALLGELALESRVDPGRVALLTGRGVAADARIEGLPAGAAALVLHETDRVVDRAPGSGETATEPAPPGVLRLGGPVVTAAPEVHGWLAQRLAVAPLAENDEAR